MKTQLKNVKINMKGWINTMGNFTLMLKRSKHTEMKDRQDMILAKGEPFLEFQSQYEGKWYKKFMNPVRVKYGDGETPYKDLPFMNRKLRPIAELCIEIGLITVIQIIIILMLFTVL